MPQKAIEEYNDFKIFQECNKDLIKNYEKKLPVGLINIWKEYGFGSFMYDYLKIVNPESFSSFLKSVYKNLSQDATVIFTTSLADLIILERGFIVQLNFRKGKSKVLASNFDFFLIHLTNEYFLNKKLEWQPYLEARKKLGGPPFDECFGYEPILAAGGVEKVENLHKVKLIEHIELITQFTGLIQ